MKDEHILVVPRILIMDDTIPYCGIKKDTCDTYIQRIQNNKQFLPRHLMEHDKNYKQIIPYLVFKYQDSFFVMQRSIQATEVRLQNKFTLGIGGHIRKEDMINDSIIEWASREFHEEVFFEGTYGVKIIGIINDDTTDVGKMHLGLLLLLDAENNNIRVRSELKSGKLMPLSECILLKPQMETWSQLVVDYLLEEL